MKATSPDSGRLVIGKNGHGINRIIRMNIQNLYSRFITLKRANKGGGMSPGRQKSIFRAFQDFQALKKVVQTYGTLDSVLTGNDLLKW